MRSELFRIPYEVAGVPLFGVGVLLGLWLAAAAAGLWLVRRRAARSGASAPLAALLGEHGLIVAGVAAVLVFLPSVFPGGLPIRGYGVMLLLAMGTGLAMAAHRAKLLGLDPDVIYSLTFWMIAAGILGARLFFVIEYWDVAFTGPDFVSRVRKALFFTEGGLVVYGSLIGAAAVFCWRCWKEKLPTLAVADLLAPSLAVGLAIGRIGCLLNGCCYGGPCERPWAVTFPKHHRPATQAAAPPYSPLYGDQVGRGEMHGVRLAEDASSDPPAVVVAAVRREPAPPGLEVGRRVVAINGAAVASLDDARGQLLFAYDTEQPVAIGFAGGAGVRLPAAPIRERTLPVHPTQLYSAINAGLLGWFLWAYFPRRRRDGEVIGLLLSIYPVSRFLLEIIRTDESAFLETGLSISQNVSVVILASMAGYWLWLRSRPRGVALAAA